MELSGRFDLQGHICTGEKSEKVKYHWPHRFYLET